jgi:DNA-binding CsgD family transcriptional regulator
MNSKYVVTSATAAKSRPSREADILRRVAEFAAAADELFDEDIEQPGEGELDAESAAMLVSSVKRLTVEELRNATSDSSRVTELTQLGLLGADLDAALRQLELRRRKAALAGVESALARMRSLPTQDDLVAAVCPELVRTCGFSRAMLSRVSGTSWRPWMAHFSHRKVTADDVEWMATFEIPMKSMVLEREVLDTGRSAFVGDSLTDPRAYRAFAEQTGARSYAVAPIMPHGRVIGLLHADFYPTTRAVDEVDAHILGAFADGFGHIYERTVLLQRLAEERDQVREMLRQTETMMDNLARAELELVRHADERSAISAAATLALTSTTTELDEVLTAREREVMALLVTGQTNSAIAERLVISEGTVKSHVKQILRKLGAVNRSELIARYLGLMSEGLSGSRER